jgi:O-antigen/teichoic acid export membrane protein
MNSIWNNLYDKAKDRRYGALFFSSLIAFFVVFLLGALIYKILGGIDFGPPDLQARLLELAPGILILIAALVWRGIRRARAQREKSFRREELSRDEIRKARSKLVIRK